MDALDELGRGRVSVPPEAVQDPFEKLVPGFGLCRDPERVPMRWNGSPNGGFTAGKPLLPMLDDKSRNVEEQARNERSVEPVRSTQPNRLRSRLLSSPLAA